MLTNQATLIKLFTLSFVIYLLASCGSGGSSEGNSTEVNQQPLPTISQETTAYEGNLRICSFIFGH